MIVASPPRRRRRRAPRRLGLALVRLLVVASLFALGVALGQALEDNPVPGPTTERVRTLVPLPATRTVTVTVTAPRP